MNNEQKVYPKHHIDIVTNRYNSFLIGTAFLVTAFVAAVINMNHSCHIILIANALNAVGFYLAVFFAIANYHGSLRIEGKRTGNLPELVCNFLKNVLDLVWRPTDTSAKYRAGYLNTWLIPCMFCIFWLIMWFAIFPHWWVPMVFGIGVPVGVVVISMEPIHSFLSSTINLIRK